MNKVLTAILVIMLTSGVLMAGCSGETSQTPQVGKPAPDFQFQIAEGQATSLSQLKGKPVLVNFWATWCGPCAYEMPYLQQFYDEKQRDEVVLLAINVGESPSQVAEFMQSQGFSFPVLLDSEGKISQQYGIRAVPTTFLIDKYGIIQEIKVGAFQSKAEIESSLSKLQ